MRLVIFFLCLLVGLRQRHGARGVFSVSCSVSHQQIPCREEMILTHASVRRVAPSKLGNSACPSDRVRNLLHLANPTRIPIGNPPTEHRE